MKSKAILVSLIAIFAVLTIVSFASAAVSRTGDLNVVVKTTVDGADADSDTIILSEKTGATVPIKVQVTNDENETLNDVKIKVEVLNSDVETETSEDDFLSGRTYTKYMTLKLPQNIKEDTSKDYRLVVTVTSDEGDYRVVYNPFTVQRENYNLEVLSVETAKSVTAGSAFGVNVVLKNRGSHRLDDAFVTVRIPALDVEKKAYFGDLTPVDSCNGDCDNEDAVERTMFLQIPSDAKAGIYNLEVEASNEDASSTTTKSIAVTGSEQRTDVLASVTSKEVKSGEATTYDIVIINSGDKIAVYDIVPESAQNLVVSIDDSVVTVPADSSRTVKVNVQAGEVMGTFNFAVNVNSQDKLVKRVNFTANVGKKTIASNVMILTVVLAIIFVVLLIVLIVLLTRKPEKTEEFGESYY